MLHDEVLIATQEQCLVCSVPPQALSPPLLKFTQGEDRDQEEEFVGCEEVT